MKDNPGPHNMLPRTASIAGDPRKPRAILGIDQDANILSHISGLVQPALLVNPFYSSMW
jgi:hypothetical protein